MRRAIPPDLAQAHPPIREVVHQHEAIGDLHLAADNFSGAVESYAAALRELGLDRLADRCRVLEKVADAECRRGDYEASLQPLEEARETARLLHEPRLTARIAARRAHALTELGRYRKSRRYARYAYSVLRDTDEHRTVAQVGVTLGLSCARLGRNAEAIIWLQDAAATFRRIDDVDGLVTALNNLGLVYKNRREWPQAIRFFEQAFELDKRAGLYARMRGHYQNLGLVRYRLGQWDLAEENFKQSLRISLETSHQQGEAAARLALGMLCRRRRQYERAEEHFQRALTLAAGAGVPRETLLAREFLGELALDRGDAAGAAILLTPALDEALAIAPEGDVVAEIETRLGLAFLIGGKEELAEEHLLRGEALALQLGDPIEVGIAARGLARLAAKRRNAAAMDAKLQLAKKNFENVGEVYELAVTLAARAELLLLLPPSARTGIPLEPVAEEAKRAATLFRQLGLIPPAAASLLALARHETERAHYDQALTLLEQAQVWLGESGDPETKDRAEHLRRDLERQCVSVLLTACNEFRALGEANRLFRETSNMSGLLNQAVKLAVERAGGDRGFVAFTNGGCRLDVVAEYQIGREAARRILRVIEEVGGSRIEESGPIFSIRATADPRFSGSIAGALANVSSLVCIPLSFPSQSTGLVYVDRLNDNLHGAFNQTDLNLLAVLANSTAVAIVEAQRSLLLVENKELRLQLKPSSGLTRVVTESPEMNGILKLLTKVGSSSASVLFMGETGTGKSLLAGVVHEISNRRDGPFIQVNCASIPEQLLESELFGYMRGAFTGAVRDKTGLFQEADGGTIFLDEIEKVPASVQAKLLHVLDRSEVRPVGATRFTHIDARVICATGCDLRERIREGTFLEDLYYRLNDITIRVPALRERREDIQVLARHFLETYSRQMDKSIPGFSPDLMKAFEKREWRGNVRELEKTVKRLVVLGDQGETLQAELLSEGMNDGPSSPPAPRANGRSLRTSVTDLERRMICEALERHGWNKARAARELGLSYPTLLAKVRTFNLAANGRSR